MDKKKDIRQDKQIKQLKDKVKDLMDKYLKKRKKETKDKKKFSKIKETISKKGKKATTKSELTKLIQLLQKGVMSQQIAKSTSPFIPTTPSLGVTTTGTVAQRVAQDKKKADPLKIWRDVKQSLLNVKDKYNNDTLERQDIINIYKKIKQLASAVADDSLLLFTELYAMYGTAKLIYDYFKRFLNRHTPAQENSLSDDDSPDAGGQDGSPDLGGGGGDDDSGDAPQQPEQPEPQQQQEQQQQQPQGLPQESDLVAGRLGRFSDQRGQDVQERNSLEKPSWSEYLRANMPSMETVVGMGLTGLMAGEMARGVIGRLRGGRLQERVERQIPEEQQLEIPRERIQGIARQFLERARDLPALREAQREERVRLQFAERQREVNAMVGGGVEPQIENQEDIEREARGEFINPDLMTDRWRQAMQGRGRELGDPRTRAEMEARFQGQTEQDVDQQVEEVGQEFDRMSFEQTV